MKVKNIFKQLRILRGLIKTRITNQELKLQEEQNRIIRLEDEHDMKQNERPYEQKLQVKVSQSFMVS